MKNIYYVEVITKVSNSAYIEAENSEEAQKMIEKLYEENAGQISYEWGAEEIDHEIIAAPEPLPIGMHEADYRGDPRKIAEENTEAFKNIKTENN